MVIRKVLHFFEGLVDCSLEGDFDSKLSMLKERWEGFESMRCKISDEGIDFFSWFKKYHVEEIKSTMLRPIRIAAGLGDPPSEYCTNDSEAMNSSIKQFVHFKKSDWPVFNDKMKIFAVEQQEEVCKAIVGSGQYILKREYLNLSIAASDWFTALNDEQRENAKRKFQGACVVSLQTAANDKITEETEGEENIESTGDITVNENRQLSIDVDAASLQSGIPTLVLRQIWVKAVDLIKNNKVVPAPGCAASDRMVASTSRKKPHFVTATKDGCFECDEDCPNFMQRFICSHCVAAADDNNSLEAFVKSYGTYAKTPKGRKTITPNFTRSSMTNLAQQTAGRKGGKAPAKKSIVRRKTIPYEQRQKQPSLVTSQVPQYSAPSPQASCSFSPQTAASNWDWSLPMNQPPYISPYPTQYIPPPAGMSPFTDFTNYYCPPYPYADFRESSTNNTELNSLSTSASDAISEPFLIKMLNRRIKVCAGCKGQHHKNSDKGLLSPPHDICLGHKESLSYINPHSGTECFKMGNAYYHINLECIRRKHPNFTATQVECPPDVQEILTDVHYNFLQRAIGYNC